MAVTMFILLILSILTLGYCAPEACGSTGILGRAAIPIRSQDTMIPAGERVVPLIIPDGRIYACPQLNLLYLVGEEEIACDYDVPPTVTMIDYHSASVNRKGSLLQPGIAYTIYHCDSKP